jgi:hypothetical protein
MNNPIKCQTEVLNRHLTKENVQTENNHMEKCLISDVIRKSQLKQ